jgi:hypothetical protein
MPESKLEAARRSGSLTNVIGAMREEAARTETGNAGTPAREQVDIVDGSLRLAAHLAGQGTKLIDREQTMKGVQLGTTVTARGAAKTQSSRAEKLTKAIALVKGWTEEQRDQFMVSDKFEAMSDRQQELLSEAIAEVQDREYSDSIGIENIDLDAETPSVDSIMGEEDDAEDEVADDDYEALFQTAEWEAEAT